MSKIKPQLIPVIVPWQISPSVPNIEIQRKIGSQYPSSVTFIAHFKCDEPPTHPAISEANQIIKPSPKFEPSSMEIRAPFRLVRVNLVEGYQADMHPAVSDLEVIPENAYDWSEVTSSLMPNETIEQNLERTCSSWLYSGVCPDPGMYEVKNSLWLAELGEQANGLHHYLLLGHDEYIQILAKAWTWEAGQVVD